MYLIQLCHLSFPSKRGKKAKLSLKFWFELTATLSLSDLFVQSYYCKHGLWIIQSSPTPETRSYKVVNAISTIILHLCRASHPKCSSSWQGDPFPGWAPNVSAAFSTGKGKGRWEGAGGGFYSLIPVPLLKKITFHKVESSNKCSAVPHSHGEKEMRNIPGTFLKSTQLSLAAWSDISVRKVQTLWQKMKS